MRETKKAPAEAIDNSRYDHLIPHANRLLVATAKGGWRVMKVLIKFALRVPGMFVRANTSKANWREKTDI
jgi:hypothetical protein